MKLLTKFNVILLVLFGAGGAIISQVIYSFLINNAEREVLQQAELMMASATSVRDYTSSDLRPLLDLNPEHKKRFLAETVPAFGAMSTFNKLKQSYPDYAYREATLNPTNPSTVPPTGNATSLVICVTIRTRSNLKDSGKHRWDL